MMEVFLSHSLGLTISRKQEKVPLFYTQNIWHGIYGPFSSSVVS